MFKKRITHLVIYHLRGESHCKFGFYVTTDIRSFCAVDLSKHFEEEAMENYVEYRGNTLAPGAKIDVESVQMISFHISLFGLRII